MKLNKKVIIGPVIALAAVAAVIGGVAAANGGDTSATSTKDQLLERAAADLGIDAGKLEDALTQARKAVMLERLEARLDQAVTDGTITQEEATAIKSWIESRPAAVDKLGPGKFGLPGMHGRGHRGAHGFGAHGLRGHMAPGTEEGAPTPSTNTGLNL